MYCLNLNKYNLEEIFERLLSDEESDTQNNRLVLNSGFE